MPLLLPPLSHPATHTAPCDSVSPYIPTSAFSYTIPADNSCQTFPVSFRSILFYSFLSENCFLTGNNRKISSSVFSITGSKKYTLLHYHPEIPAVQKTNKNDTSALLSTKRNPTARNTFCSFLCHLAELLYNYSVSARK